jgi:hypothetical protein
LMVTFKERRIEWLHYTISTQEEKKTFIRY